MDFYGINLEGGFKRESYEILGPQFSAACRSYIKSLLAHREVSDFKGVEAPTLMVGDVVANAGDKYSPGTEDVEKISMFNLLDGGN